jgi:hypothetical protein
MLSKEYFAKINVHRVYRERLSDMTKDDIIKEGYKGLKEFEEIWIKINGTWNSNQEVYVIEFEVVK